jgi:branched-chain amino acid transport system substrate-binding protein
MGKKGIILIMAALLALAIMPGCGEEKKAEPVVEAPKAAPVAKAEPAAPQMIKIGGIFSITGGASYLGDPEKKSMEMAVSEINAAGGIEGGMVEAVIYDDEGDPSKAVLHAKRLIERDNVVAIVGPSLTPTSMAIIPDVERAQIPLISCAAGNGIVIPVKPFVFKTAQSDIHAVESIYIYMQEKGIKSVGLLCVDDGFGQSGHEQLVKQAANFEISVIADESFSASDTDMTAQLTKIRAQRPDAVICWGVGPSPAVVARNAKQLQLPMPLFMSHGVASKKFIELAGEAAEDILFPTGKILVTGLLSDEDPQKAVLQNYTEKYQARFNEPVSGFGGYAWDAMELLARALPGTGGDKAKLRDNLENLSNVVAVSGTFNFSDEDHNGLGADAFIMVRIKNGAWELAQ